MRRDKGDLAYIWDMLEAAKEARDFTIGITFEAYTRDRLRQLAVERTVEIVGEASRRVSDQFQAAHPHIAWRQIRAQRHVLAHEYGEIDPEKMWRVATVHVVSLIAQLESILAANPPSSSS